MFSISIVLYKNKAKEIINLINSIFKYNNQLITELFLIDNSPGDELKSLKEIDNRISYFFNNANLGYGKGHNIALKNAINNDYKYHLVLNPDIIFQKEIINELLNYMDHNNNVGQIMPKILYPDGNIQYLCKLIPTPIDLLIRLLMPNKFFEKRRKKFELRFTNYDKIMEVPYLSGCFMLLRIKAVKEVGFFDERFFMYPEDIDLTRRINKKYKTIFYPKVAVQHEHAKESFRSPKLLLKHIYNLILYFNKWGWVIDNDREKTNKKILQKLNY